MNDRTNHTQRRHYITATIGWVSVVLGSTTMLFVSAPVFAQSGAISQSYQTSSTSITQGTLLSLASKGSTVVVPAGTSNAASLVGVAASKPLVELSTGTSSSSKQSSVQVAVGGITEALVSNLNGAVYVGDKITASPVNGIGMKATAASEIIGIAQTNLSSVTTVTKSFAGTNGKTVGAKVGLLPIAVNVAYYSAAPAGGSISAFVPPFLQSLANSIAGKEVSPLRVLIGAMTLILGFATIVIMLYTGIRNGVISLGRNPLAADALRKGMADILITAVGILMVTGVVVAAVIAA
jgi:hypothetical protein